MKKNNFNYFVEISLLQPNLYDKILEKNIILMITECYATVRSQRIVSYFSDVDLQIKFLAPLEKALLAKWSKLRISICKLK